MLHWYKNLWQYTCDHDVKLDFCIGVQPETFQVQQAVEQKCPLQFELAVVVVVFIGRFNLEIVIADCVWLKNVCFKNTGYRDYTD